MSGIAAFYFTSDEVCNVGMSIYDAMVKLRPGNIFISPYGKFASPIEELGIRIANFGDFCSCHKFDWLFKYTIY